MMAPPAVMPLATAAPSLMAGGRPRGPEILPPAVLSARRVGAPPAPAPDIIEHVAEPKRKKGRPSKKDILAARRAKASEAIAELLDGNPRKEDVREYFRQRIEELSSA